MDIIFLRPLYLLLIPVGFGLVWIMYRHYRGQSDWGQLGDEHLIQHLLTSQNLSRQTGWPFLGLVLAWVLACIAMSGPAWERLPGQAADTLRGRMILFDLSKSMDSTDVKPSRLVTAKYKLIDLLKSGAGFEQGLIIFAGDAFIVSPMTDDIDTLTNLIPELNTSTPPSQGSRSDLAVAMALATMQQTGFNQGEIILITDGVSPDTQNLANNANAYGFRVSVLAIGTENAKPIPIAGGGYLKDNQGNIVIPNINIDALKQVTQNGGGILTTLSLDSSDIEQLNTVKSIVPDLTENTYNANANNRYLTDRWIERGPWLLIPLLLLVAMSFRRGWILLILVSLPTIHSEPARAFSWQDLWLRADQQAEQQFSEGKFDQIPDNASKSWLGAAQYRLSNFDEAAEQFKQIAPSTADSYFNRANALAKNQQFEEALTEYENALQKQPDFDAAISNYDLVKSLLDQQNKNSQSNPNDSQNNQTETDQQVNGSDDSEQREKNAGNQNGDPDRDAESNEEQDSKSTENERSNQSDPNKSEPTKNQDKQNETLNQTVENRAETARQADRSAEMLNEQQQAVEQWLNRVPDDPGGLLKRKFAQQYSQRQKQPNQQTW